VAGTPIRFKTTRRVEFAHTDSAGIAHFSTFFLYMEQAEHELLRHLGVGVVMRDDEGEIGWPRVRASCDFRHPAKFEDPVEIETTIERVGGRSVTYTHRLSCGDRQLAQGQMTAVCCRVAPGQPPKAIAIPGRIARLLRGEAAS
jgi:acyl-CoA thioester hydrolase